MIDEHLKALESLLKSDDVGLGIAGDVKAQLRSMVFSLANQLAIHNQLLSDHHSILGDIRPLKTSTEALIKASLDYLSARTEE